MEVKKFFELPFRVIISNILVNAEILLDSDSHVFLLFGYFKNDRTRKIWQIFLSVVVSITTNSVIDISRLQCIDLVAVQSSFYRIFLENSANLLHLTRLGLLKRIEHKSGSISSEEDKPRQLFSIEGAFPTLKTLEITTNAYDWRFFDFNQFRNYDGFQSLISLTLCITHEFREIDLNEENVFNVSNNWKCLKKLKVRNIRLSKEAVMKVPNLEVLQVTWGKNLLIELPIPSKLKVLKFFLPYSEINQNDLPSQISNMKDLFLRSHDLRSLSLSLNENMKCNWFLENMNMKKKLTNLILKECEFSEDPKKKMKLPPNLRFLRLYNPDEFDIELLKDNDLNLLEDLEFYFYQWIGEVLILTDSTNLRSLVFDMNDSLFEKDVILRNKWDNLEILRFKDVGTECVLTGRNWPQMKKLKVFELSINRFSDGTEFDDTFLIVNEFECLEVLNLKSLPRIIGTNWNPSVSRNLKRLDLIGLPLFDHLSGTFFTSNQFPFLEVLNLVGVNTKCPSDEPKVKWSVMPLLTNLKLDCCSGMGDWIFQRNTFEKLENLEISFRLMDLQGLPIEQDSSMYGKSWRFLPSLKNFIININARQIKDFNKGEYFGNWFWENPQFPEGNISKEKSMDVQTRKINE